MHMSSTCLQEQKKAMLLTRSLVLFVILTFFPTLCTAKTFHIAILSSGNNPIYESVIDNIKKSVVTDISTASFSTYYVDTLESVADERLINADLLLAIGRRAMVSIAQRKSSPPILVTLVPRQAFKQNYPALKLVNEKVGAVYIGSPPERQILLAKILLGDKQTIGVLLSDNSSPNKQHIASILNNIGLNSRIEIISPSDNIISKLARVLDNSDVLVALPDPLIFNRNTARNILLTTYRQRVPVIGFSDNYVKAGALAATFSTPEQISAQTGALIKKFLVSQADFPRGGKYPKDFSITTNQNVARSLGINMPPDEMIKKELNRLLMEQK